MANKSLISCTKKQGSKTGVRLHFLTFLAFLFLLAKHALLPFVEK